MLFDGGNAHCVAQHSVVGGCEEEASESAPLTMPVALTSYMLIHTRFLHAYSPVHSHLLYASLRASRLPRPHGGLSLRRCWAAGRRSLPLPPIPQAGPRRQLVAEL